MVGHRLTLQVFGVSSRGLKERGERSAQIDRYGLLLAQQN